MTPLQYAKAGKKPYIMLVIDTRHLKRPLPGKVVIEGPFDEEILVKCEALFRLMAVAP